MKVCLKIETHLFSSNEGKCCKKSLESYCIKLISHHIQLLLHIESMFLMQGPDNYTSVS